MLYTSLACHPEIVDDVKPRKAFNMALKCFIKAFIGPYKRLMRGLIMTFIRAL